MKEIPLTQGMYALVDDEDYALLSMFHWCVSVARNGRNYAVRGSGKTRVFMHRFVMQTPDDQIVDHLDHNGLNNQKTNLVNCTQSENVHRGKTYSKYKGVYWDKTYKFYCAQISYKGRRKFIGYYKTENEAAKAYNKVALRIYGKSAYQNVINEDN